jgi:hypothetical protein
MILKKNSRLSEAETTDLNDLAHYAGYNNPTQQSLTEEWAYQTRNQFGCEDDFTNEETMTMLNKVRNMILLFPS